MAKFVRKPQIVEAFQFDPENPDPRFITDGDKLVGVSGANALHQREVDGGRAFAKVRGSCHLLSPLEWLVDTGDASAVFSDEEFRDQFDPAPKENQSSTYEVATRVV